jgi:hypothetical protein
MVYAHLPIARSPIAHCPYLCPFLSTTIEMLLEIGKFMANGDNIDKTTFITNTTNP